ncbi:hypothetical protein DFQ28_009270 [Apophysomyces sp. BC1034]|nr:hypothetical protein DFQ28_009270 [Apophysomyces sp. BC1034]
MVELSIVDDGVSVIVELLIVDDGVSVMVELLIVDDGVSVMVELSIVDDGVSVMVELSLVDDGVTFELLMESVPVGFLVIVDDKVIVVLLLESSVEEECVLVTVTVTVPVGSSVNDDDASVLVLLDLWSEAVELAVPVTIGHGSVSDDEVEGSSVNEDDEAVSVTTGQWVFNDGEFKVVELLEVLVDVGDLLVEVHVVSVGSFVSDDIVELKVLLSVGSTVFVGRIHSVEGVYVRVTVELISESVGDVE